MVLFKNNFERSKKMNKEFSKNKDPTTLPLRSKYQTNEKNSEVSRLRGDIKK